MKTKFNIAFNIISLCIFFLFFFTWLHIDIFEVEMKGATIPFKLPVIVEKYHIVAPIKMTYVIAISYLLYLIPILTIVHIISQLKGKNIWFLQLDYLVTLIAFSITCYVVLTIDPSASLIFTKYFYAIAVFAILGIVLQIIRFLVTRKAAK